MLNIPKKTFQYVVNVVFLGLELGQCQCRWVHVTYIESFHDIYGVAIGFEATLMVCCSILYIKFFAVFGAVLSFLVDQECDEAFVECMFGAIGKRQVYVGIGMYIVDPCSTRTTVFGTSIQCKIHVAMIVFVRGTGSMQVLKGKRHLTVMI